MCCLHHILLCLNSFSTKYGSLISAFETFFSTIIGVIGIFISVALFKIANSNYKLAQEEKRSREQRISADEKQVFRDVYEKITRALGLSLVNFHVTNEAHKLFWQARDRARLELPEEIQRYTQEIFDLMHNAWNINTSYLGSSENGGLPKGDDRNRKSKEHTELMTKLSKIKPSEIFSKYLKPNEKEQ